MGAKLQNATFTLRQDPNAVAIGSCEGAQDALLFSLEE